MSIQSVIASLLFLIIFLLISTEKIHKTVIALTGAVIFILFRFTEQNKAFADVDWNVIFLLVGMMMIVAIMKHTGIFQYVAIKSAKMTKGNPVKILMFFTVITAVFSAFLDNVTTVLIIVPVTILIAVELGVSPEPFVISEAISSNIGGSATLIGDPPNIMIGSAAKLTFLDFIINLSPVIIIIMVVTNVLLYFMFKKKLVVTNERKARIMEFDESKTIENKPLLIKSLIILFIVIIGFMFHGFLRIEPATIALGGAAFLMLITDSHKFEKVMKDIDWTTIFFFIGLFVIIDGLVRLGIIGKLSQYLLAVTKGDIELTTYIILWGSGILSALVDNIPYVATMIPLIENFKHTLGSSDISAMWWALSLGACLGGNGTLIGASANVVSAGIAEKSGYKISFLTFAKYGIIITIISLLISNLYIIFRYF
ncbi:ArsB/NhaD family transporter [Candidatus Dependentiae bacterium]|nr:ArsB/NhaD family transporter [Candidatus Dependentiae bacterium]